MNQQMILLAYLQKNGRTSCAVLEWDCDVRSVTTRMSELGRKGVPINKTVKFEPDTRGKLRRVTYYELDPNPAQPDLFPQQ